MKTFKPVILLIIAAFTFSACDDVTEFYEEDVTFNPERKVLVEDYTGHQCGNCPRAARSVYDLKEVYGDNLIIIAVHAGFFARVNPPQAGKYTYDFKTPAGDELNSDFGIVSNPNGMVNRRTNTDGSHVFPYTSWADEVSKVLTDFTQVPASITISNDYEESSRTLTTEITTDVNVNLPSSYRLSVYLIEDKIVNWQKDYDMNPEDIEDYVHKEVLRGALNGTYGDKISGISEGNTNSNTYTIALDPEFVADECSIVAFLFDETTKEIIEVEQALIK